MSGAKGTAGIGEGLGSFVRASTLEFRKSEEYVYSDQRFCLRFLKVKNGGEENGEGESSGLTSEECEVIVSRNLESIPSEEKDTVSEKGSESVVNCYWDFLGQRKFSRVPW